MCLGRNGARTTCIWCYTCRLVNSLHLHLHLHGDNDKGLSLPRKAQSQRMHNVHLHCACVLCIIQGWGLIWFRRACAHSAGVATGSAVHPAVLAASAAYDLADSCATTTSTHAQAAAAPPRRRPDTGIRPITIGHSRPDPGHLSADSLSHDTYSSIYPVQGYIDLSKVEGSCLWRPNQSSVSTDSFPMVVTREKPQCGGSKLPPVICPCVARPGPQNRRAARRLHNSTYDPAC